MAVIANTSKPYWKTNYAINNQLFTAGKKEFLNGFTKQAGSIHCSL